MEVLDRFWRKVIPGRNGCLEFTSCVGPSGYGNFRYKGRMRRAHRFIYQTLIGEIPEGLELNHICWNRACVNVNHLEAVTHQKNAAYRVRAGYCINGHELTTENTFYRKDGYKECYECKRRHSREYMRQLRRRRRDLELVG